MQIREYHRRHPAARVVDVNEDDGLLKEEPQIEFSGEVDFFLCLEVAYNCLTQLFIKLIDCLIAYPCMKSSHAPHLIMKTILMLVFSYFYGVVIGFDFLSRRHNILFRLGYFLLLVIGSTSF